MRASVLAIILIAAGLASAQTSKSKAKAAVSARTLPPPKDESGRDKALAAFLLRLKDVLKRKDREALQAMLAPDVEPGIGSQRGAAAFSILWELNDPDGGVYGLMMQILSLPGVWVQDQFCGPYVGIQFPSDLDPSKYQVLLNPDVKLRATASQSGKVLTTLSYNIVEVLERGEWMKVKTESGLTGYVPSAYIYSPAAYRMCVAKNAAGMWQIASLKAGR
jgi:hypothetical protein